MPQKLSIEEVNRMDRAEFVTRFGGVFERSPWVAEGAWERRSFEDLDGLHAAFVETVRDAPEDRRVSLIRAHPDLAGKAALAGELTEESAGEQASAGLDRLSPEEYERFHRLNAAYGEKFGLPYVVCVRDHTKETIFAGAERRLSNTREEEIAAALYEISRISRLRLEDLVEGSETPGGATVSETPPKTSPNIVLGQNNYGKSEVRLFKVKRDTAHHEVWDLDLRVTLEGDFDAAHYRGDNSGLLATDTMRNTVYALAKDRLTGSIERFGLALVDHFLEAGPTVTACRVEITQFRWRRIEVDGQPHDHSFVRERGERKAKVSGDETGARRVEAGIDDVYVMKTTNSGWEGFYRDRFTTLPETDDRVLATIVTAKWEYGVLDADFDQLWEGVMETTLETFTDHYSPSVQNTLYRMGKAVLEEFPQIERIWYSFPNVHHIVYDLGRFGIENENEILHATRDPYGQIEGWVERRP